MVTGLILEKLSQFTKTVYSEGIFVTFLSSKMIYAFFTEEDEGTTDRTLMYYVNDGVYGSFNCILYDHAHCLPTLHKVNENQGLKWQ